MECNRAGNVGSGLPYGNVAVPPEACALHHHYRPPAQKLLSANFIPGKLAGMRSCRYPAESGRTSAWISSGPCQGLLKAMTSSWSKLMLSRMAHFLPCKSNFDSPGMAQLFAEDRIWCLDGLPRSVVTDYNIQFEQLHCGSVQDSWHSPCRFQYIPSRDRWPGKEGQPCYE